MILIIVDYAGLMQGSFLFGTSWFHNLDILPGALDFLKNNNLGTPL